MPSMSFDKRILLQWMIVTYYIIIFMLNSNAFNVSKTLHVVTLRDCLLCTKSKKIKKYVISYPILQFFFHPHWAKTKAKGSLFYSNPSFDVAKSN